MKRTPTLKLSWRRRRCSRARRGATVTELVAAASLLAVAAVLLVPVIAGVAGVRDGATEHQLAVLEAANLMERIAALRSRGPLTRGQLDGLSLSPAIEEQLTDPQLNISLGESAGSPAARALAVEISWENEQGQRGAAVRVVTYLYEREGSDDARP